MKKDLLKYGAVVGVAGIAFAAGTTGGAVADRLIGSPQIKDNSIQAVDLAPNSVKGSELAPGGVTWSILSQGMQDRINGIHGKTGPQGPAGVMGLTGLTGATGPKGDTGAKGDNGVSGLEYRTYDYITGGARTGHDGVDSSYTGAGSGGIATVACSSQSKVAIAGGVQFLGLDGDNGDAAVAGGEAIVDSFPGRMDWSTFTPLANRLDGWIVRLNKAADGEPVTVWAICANVS